MTREDIGTLYFKNAIIIILNTAMYCIMLCLLGMEVAPKWWLKLETKYMIWLILERRCHSLESYKLYINKQQNFKQSMYFI